jgi:hypothetical protein
MNDSNPSGSCSVWNKGKITDPKPPLRPGHVWAIRASCNSRSERATWQCYGHTKIDYIACRTMSRRRH